MSDMNFNTLTVTEIKTSFLLKQVISSPTGITTLSQSLIDYIGNHAPSNESGVLPIYFSDQHAPVLFHLCKSTHHTHQNIRKIYFIL